MKTSLIAAIMIVFKAVVSFYCKAKGVEILQADISTAALSFQSKIASFMGRGPPSIKATKPINQNRCQQQVKPSAV